jgi:glucose/mannose-6-phosphate isomerase
VTTDAAASGGVLDRVTAMRRYDAAGMLGSIAALPDQLRDGWQRSRQLELPESHRGRRSVALLGMGGSAVGGDLVRAVLGDRLRVPLVVVRDYELPAWVRPDALVVASSYSGATEETISALGAALERRCPVAIIATGGPLRDVAQRAGLPLLAFPGGGQPRAAAGYSLSLLGGLLERAGLVELDDAAIEAAAAHAETAVRACAPEVPTSDNPAKRLAWSLVDRLPVVEASGFLAVVARRWKTQLNENSKTMAVHEELPEATHNTVVGYAQPESVRDHLYFVFLRSTLDHPRNEVRARLSRELLEAGAFGSEEVRIEGNGRLAQAAWAIVLGDYVSTYLAFLYGLDPSPVENIAFIKERMSAVDEGDDE